MSSSTGEWSIYLLFFISSDHIFRTLDAGTYYIKQNDPRQAFTIVKRVISHPNASYSQKYRAYEGLAAIFNISRHVDIVDRTRMDIVRTDRQLEDLLRFLLQEDMPTCAYSLHQRVVVMCFYASYRGPT